MASTKSLIFSELPPRPQRLLGKLCLFYWFPNFSSNGQYVGFINKLTWRDLRGVTIEQNVGDGWDRIDVFDTSWFFGGLQKAGPRRIEPASLGEKQVASYEAGFTGAPACLADYHRAIGGS